MMAKLKRKKKLNKIKIKCTNVDMDHQSLPNAMLSMTEGGILISIYFFSKQWLNKNYIFFKELLFSTEETS